MSRKPRKARTKTRTRMLGALNLMTFAEATNKLVTRQIAALMLKRMAIRTKVEAF